jgi:hypothetical protein
MMIAEFVIASLRTCEHGPRLTLRSAIVIVGVGLQDSKQMHLAQDKDVVHTLTPDRSDPVVWGDRASNGRMDRQSTDGGVWLGANPKLPDPGPQWRLRRDIHPPGSIRRYSRSSDASSLTVENAYDERLIGSIRREFIDHIVIFGERHPRHVLLSYMTYYNDARTHLSLNKDVPVPRAADTAGVLSANQSWADCIINIPGFDLR